MIKRYLFLIIILLFVNDVSIANKLDSLLKVVSQSKVDTTLINCWNELSLQYAKIDTQKANVYVNKAIELSKKINYQNGISMAYYKKAYLAENAYQYPLAEKYYLMGIEQAKNNNNFPLEAYGLCDYAVVLKKQKKFKEALECNKKTLSKYLSLNDSPGISRIYTNMGNNYKALNQFDKAISAHLNALHIEQKLHSDKGIAKAYNNIGLVYERNGDHQSALRNYLLMLEPAKNSGSKEMLAAAYNNIGSSYQNLKEHQRSIPYFEKALAINEDMDDLPNVALDLSNLAAAYNDLRQYTKAIQYSTQCIEIAQKASDIESEGYAFLNLSESYRNLENYSAAKPSLMRALQLVDSIKSVAYTMLVYEELSNHYQQTKDFKQAYKYLQMLTVLKDSVYNEETHLQISSLQTQYQTAEKEKALSESNADNLKKSLLLQKKNNLLIIAFGGLLLIAFLSILIWRNAHLRKVKLIQEKELSEAKAKHQLQEEKLRISRELHDNIGAQLTFINSSLQHLSTSNDEEMEQTRTMTLNTIRELRSIVWLINKEEFYLEELVIKLRDLMKPLQNKKPRIEILSKANEDIKLKAQIASNVLRIIQEATNNTIKYAQANVLNILVDSTNQALLKLRILDDGIGFDVQSVQYSFGLKNMESRVKDMNGKIEIKSSIGIGTELNIEVPLAT